MICCHVYCLSLFTGCILSSCSQSRQPPVRLHWELPEEQERDGGVRGCLCHRPHAQLYSQGAGPSGFWSVVYSQLINYHYMLFHFTFLVILLLMSLTGNVSVCSVAALLQLSQSSIEIRCSQDPQQGKTSSRTATIHQLISQLVANYFDNCTISLSNLGWGHRFWLQETFFTVDFFGDQTTDQLIKKVNDNDNNYSLINIIIIIVVIILFSV